LEASKIRVEVSSEPSLEHVRGVSAQKRIHSPLFFLDEYIAAAGIVGDANGYLFRTTAPKSGVLTERPMHHPKSHSCKICLSDGRKSKSQTLKDAGIAVSSANDYEQLAGGRDASTITGLLALSYRTFRAKRILADRSESQIAEDPKLVRTAQGR
jgi:hypothetical protein